MLLQLREFIRREGVVSTQQLTRAFHVDEATLAPMLEIWLAKGAIKKCHEKSACQSTCFQCKENKPIYYQFNG